MTRDLGVTPEVIEGARGEFSISVDGRIVARKDSRGFPDEEQVLARVREALGA